MVQVKEFSEFRSVEEPINNWLREKGDSIKIIDIKYNSVGIYGSYSTVNYASALIIYNE